MNIHNRQHNRVETQKVQLDLQNATTFATIPSIEVIQKWVEIAYQADVQTTLCIRVVDNKEGQQLNAMYRGKNSATNVLSFVFESPTLPIDADESLGSSLHYLGDLVLCHPVVQREAMEQQKPLIQHWAHLIIHGVLHLQGYDHISAQDAHRMESLEIQLLERLGIANPYQIQ